MHSGKIYEQLFFSIHRRSRRYIPSPGKMGPTVIDKGQPIELIGSRLRDHTRTFDCGVRAWQNPTRGRYTTNG